MAIILLQEFIAWLRLLILDEPANHLDYVGIAWLENFLSSYKGAVLIISHNRYLYFFMYFNISLIKIESLSLFLKRIVCVLALVIAT